jgi:hypothetical protein
VAPALFATGGYLMLGAAPVLSAFVVSLYAIPNDVYMGNLFVGPPLLLIGSVLLLASLLVARSQGRVMAWGQGLLAMASSGVLTLLYIVIGGHYVSVGPFPNGPLYLDELMMGVTLALSLAVFIMPSELCPT